MSGSTSVLTPVGWALLHFVWQGVLVALALAAVLWLVPGRAARVRYALACLALAAMGVVPIVTLTWLAADPSGITRWSTTSVGLNLGMSVPERLSSIANAASSPSSGAGSAGLDLPRLLPWLSMLWACGVACCAVRLAGGWWQTRRLLRRDTTEPDGEWQALVSAMSSRIGLRRAVRVLASARIDVPVVAGAIVPVLLLPVSALSGLTPRQVEAVIAHELAHIRRHDYLVNLVQSAVECLLFYHPAVWWVSHVIRVEREHCCDDLAVLACGDPLLYARALTNMEALRRGHVGMAMAASGGSLLSRVRRLVGARPPARVGSSGWVLAAMTALMVAGAGATNWVSGWATALPDVELAAPQAAACCPASVAASQAPSESRATTAAEATAPTEAPVMAPPADAPHAVAVFGVDAPVITASAEADVASVADLIDMLQRSVRDLSRAAGVPTRALERLDLQRQLSETARQLRVLRATRADTSAQITHELRLAERADRDRIRRDADAERLVTRGRTLAEKAQRWCRDNGVAPPPPPVPPAAPSATAPPPPPAVAAPPVPPMPPTPRAASDAPRAVQPLPPLPPPTAIAPPAPVAALPPPPPAFAAPPAPVVEPPQPPPPAPIAPAAPVAAPPPPTPVPPVVAPAPPPPPPHALVQLDSGGTWSMSMSEDGQRLTVRGKGRIELTDASDDVKSLEPGGYFMIETGNEAMGEKGTSKFSATRGSNGAVGRWYVVNGRRVGPEEGRAWLARTLPAFVRDHATTERLER